MYMGLIVPQFKNTGRREKTAGCGLWKLSFLFGVLLISYYSQKESGVFVWQRLRNRESNSPAAGAFCAPYSAWR